MIPPLDERGLLPPGVHMAAGWAELQASFVSNDHRRQLLVRMQDWVRDELQHVGAGLDLVIGGSFVSSKPVPGDIDCTVIIPTEEIGARGPLLQLLVADGRKGRIWQQYRVEAYPTLRSAGANDFSAYFQYVGEKSALLHRCAPTDLRGVVKVETWLPG